jgi:hypothetical protein
MSSIFTTVPHPRIEERKQAGPPTVADQLARSRPLDRFNAALAVKITTGVGTMWCAYVFAGIALISLPDALRSGTSAIISWIAQTFLQLVLLSIIIVGQNVQSAAADKRAEATYEDADAVLHTATQIQAHLEAQDAVIEKILAQVSASGG